MTFHHNENNHNYRIAAAAAAATIFTVVIIMATSTMVMNALVEATTIGNTTTNTTTTPSSEIELLSQQPIYQEQIRNAGQTAINQTHIQITYAGNGTFTLPNATESTIGTTSSRSGIASMIDNDFAGKEILTTGEDGSENATATVYELLRFDMQEGTGRGITMATFHTNSTGMLAPLDGMILAGTTELYPNGAGLVTLWEWQNGGPFPPSTTITAEEPSSPMNTTTTDSSSTDTSSPSEENEQWWQQFWDR
jgi:hypothetical protein